MWVNLSERLVAAMFIAFFFGALVGSFLHAVMKVMGYFDKDFHQDGE